MFTLEELNELISAVETMSLEYRETPERVALVAKLRGMRDAMKAEIERHR